MKAWVLEPTGQYEKDYKWFEKKLPEELKAILDNLDTYFRVLNECGSPMQVMFGFIHNEPEGIKAIDQKGGGKRTKPRQARLYVFPDSLNNTLYLLKMGTKTNQRDDISNCREQVRKIKGERR